MTQQRSPRIDSVLPVSLDGSTAALSVDVSREGFCLLSPTLMAPGSEVSGTVLHGPLRLAFKGRVAWTKAGNPMASTWHRVGVRLEKVSPGLRALLGLTLG
jgi:hypothetical protein